MVNKSLQLTGENYSRVVSEYCDLGNIIDRFLSAVALIAVSPIFLINIICAKLLLKPSVKLVESRDCLNRKFHYYVFSAGILKRSLMLTAIWSRKVGLCGMPTHLSLTRLQKDTLRKFKHVPVGVFDLVSLKRASGLVVEAPELLLKNQFSHSFSQYLGLVFKGAFNKLIFRGDKVLGTPNLYSLFGLKVNNVSMKDAVSWATDKSAVCKLGCFINVNSINLISKNAQLTHDINHCDRVFADGSGVRLAAKKIGVAVKENVNGTDMLPHLCQAMIKKGLSIYLLGAQEGVAVQMANNLKAKYPTIRIVGVRNGYFSENNATAIVEDINASKADILLVGMGSPVQENWLNTHGPSLKCRTALAVGGLFDFYSGKIPRAPIWMRELGLEWVWRLIQEPSAKFRRYVIGNPLFLFRTFVLNHAAKEL